MRKDVALISGRGIAVAGALAPVDISVAAGESVFVTGRSGSGKTTLLRCLAALEARAEGELAHRGLPVSGDAVPSFRRKAVYVAQFPPGFDMSVEDLFRYPFSLKYSVGRYDSERVLSLATALNLPDDILLRRVSDLSGGERQRVAVIAGLILDPDVALLDEPTSALDPEARGRMCDVLEGWLGDSNSLVVVSHDQEVTRRLASRTIELEHAS